MPKVSYALFIIFPCLVRYLLQSLALLTALKFGLPENIIKRAEELSEHWDSDTKNCNTEESSFKSESKRSTRTIDIHHAVAILEEVVGVKGSSSIVQIPSSCMSPPSLEGTSCVYILQIGGEGEDEGRSVAEYYVGETDSLFKRLSQHRSRWPSLSAIAVRIEKGGKSRAREVENLVTRRMAKSGFDLVSFHDGLRRK